MDAPRANVDLMTAEFGEVLLFLTRAFRGPSAGLQNRMDRVMWCLKDEELMTWLAARLRGVELSYAAEARPLEDALMKVKDRVASERAKILEELELRANASAAENSKPR